MDTADSYQVGQSEEWVGEFIAGRRDDFVLATKFTLGLRQDSTLLAVGNNRKNMIRSSRSPKKTK